MKKTLIVLMLLFGSTVLAHAAENGVYINGFNRTTKPFAYLEDGVAKGFDIDSLEWIGKELGIKFRHEPIVWSEGPDLIRSGKIDLIASSMTITVPRMLRVRFSNPYWNAGQAVFVLNTSSLDFNKVQKGQVGGIAAMRASTGAEWVQSAVVNANNLAPDAIINVDDYDGVIDAVLKGRAAAGVVDSPIVNLLIADKPLKVVGVADTGEQYGVAMRRSDIRLMRLINLGYFRLMHSPEWAVLKARYNLD